MLKIHELKQERAKVIETMDEIVKNCMVENRAKNNQEMRIWNMCNENILRFDEKITELQLEESRNLRSGKVISVNNRNESLSNWLQSVSRGEKVSDYKFELRADPILSTTDSNIINNVVKNVDIMFSPNEELLKALGVNVLYNCNGTISMPSMDQIIVKIANENEDASTADMVTSTNKLNLKRFTAYQTISLETLAQTNGMGETIMSNLYNSLWNKVVEDYFDQLDVDAATRIKEISGATLTFDDIVMMEASVGQYDLLNPKYVMSPETKAFCKKTAALTNQEAIWKNGKVNEYNAYSSTAVNGEKIYFGDFNKSTVAQWDAITTIVDPYSDAKKGLVTFTIVGMFDSGVQNKNAFCIINDASTY
jgi:hypothetical protein